jgi:anti-sigma factor RsiW
MSETTPHTNDACELLLDYVYGELDEARKRTFEEHLPGCARCQQEVASFGRVRTAAKRMMPAVEPTAPLAGALHAQLMHAAAQRKPRRGVLLAFPRKIVEHPALSAAAMFVLVGGAIAINWSRGKMAMPATAEQHDVDAPKPAEVATPAPKAPAAGAPMPEAKQKEQAESDVQAALDNKNEGGFYKGGDKSAATGSDQTKLALETGSGTYTVQRPAAHRATAAPKKAAPARMKGIAVDGKLAKYDALDDSLDRGAKDEAAAGKAGQSDGIVGGIGGASGGGGRGAVAANAKSSAPEELNRRTVAEKAPARDIVQQQQHGYATSTPAKPQPQSSTGQQAWGSSNGPAAAPPPPPAAATAPSSEREYARAQSQPVTVAKPSAAPRNFDVLRKNADEWAKTGRCDDAMKMYQELEKANQYISPTERVSWIRCLTQRGRQEEAQQRLDELRSEKRITNSQIQDAEKELNDSRRRVDGSQKGKAAKKAPAADRAPVQATTQQRAAEPAPAQAAPPDSTNTKVKQPAY